MKNHLIAYMISAYTEPQSLVALVEKLDEDYVDFYVHIDKKVDIAQFCKQLINKKNVLFIENRIKVSWGGWSQVQMQYALINAVLCSGIHYMRIVNLTGTDYPVVSNSVIKEKMWDRNIEYITGYRLADDLKDAQDKVLYYYEYDKGKYIRLFWAFIRKVLKIRRYNSYNSINCNFYFGSEYWALTYDTLNNLMGKWEKDNKMQFVLKHASVPSEIWIHTLFFNSNVARKGKVFVRQYEGLSQLAPITYFEYGKEVKILTQDDYPRIIQSGKMFARKIITGKSDNLIDIIKNNGNVSSS